MEYEQELNEYQDLHTQIMALEETLRESRARDLVGLLKKSGKMKGELPGLTPAQYRQLVGRPAAQAMLKKAQGMTTPQIPWEYSLDQLAGERGYPSGDSLRDDIYKTRDMMDELDDLKHQKQILGEKLKRAGQETEIKKFEAIVEKLTGKKAPVFSDGSEAKAEKTTIDGMTIVRTRQFPFWQVEVDTDGKPPPETVIRVRYAADAKKLIRAAARDQSEKANAGIRDIKGFRPLSGRHPRLSPKTPKLK